ncbi:penicillin-binding protein 1A [Williamwhitmania taraxaci]|uniref:Penicillin-binding protein 1A n=1 Tax=Williamwhitmania taraxaci TaxID=1640674 RepID=A0A1G6SQ53_9BACT|nr:transglycosylase domain-containing protein [Williamwhitmania taraxaci]SDD18992.1 penicillin-binding protein 1A [Williamwhitmania taraxaci]
MKNSLSFKKKFLIWFWAILAFPLVVAVVLFTLITLEVFGPMPSFEDLENPTSNLASEVYSEDNVLLGKYYIENRSYTSYEELSPNIENALISIEDVRFRSHSGIDFRGLGRVLVKTIVMGDRDAGGGSTLTQQLAKNLFPRDTSHNQLSITRKSKLVLAKLKEWVTAVKLERNYTKDEILSMYLNTVPFGGTVFGIKSAAKTYFNTSPDSLSIEQAALLAGLVNAPTRYSPVRNPERSLARRNLVIEKMARYGFIGDVLADSLKKQPVVLHYQVQDHNEGLATYFRETLRIILTATEPVKENFISEDSYKTDSLEWATNPLYGWCNKNIKADGSPYNIYRDGLRIYSTLNGKMQEYAEEAVVAHLSQSVQPAFDKEQKSKGYPVYSRDVPRDQVERILEQAMRQSPRYYYLRQNGLSEEQIKRSFNTKTSMTVFTYKGERDTVMTPLDSIKHYKRYLRAGFMAMDPHTGYVKAYVGGPNYRYFKYDQVTKGKRQVGSTIKPFLYTLAMQEGYSPCRLVPNVPQTFVVGDSTWTPTNSGDTDYDGQMVTLKWGLANSVNNISAWLMKQFNPQNVVEISHKLGIKSFIDPVVSIFLGTSDFTVAEMVGAYATYANRGIHIDPLYVTRIEDKNGNVLATFKTKKNEAISEQTAYLMINLLQGVIDHGTGRRLRYRYQLPGPLAGKTGTTNNQSDGWFMGITPNLVGGAWVGGEDRAIHFEGITQGQGASMALPIWGMFLQKVYADPSLGINGSSIFAKPVSLSVDIDCPVMAADIESEKNNNGFFD